MSNSRAFRRQVSGSGEASRMIRRNTKKLANRRDMSTRTVDCPTHGSHTEMWLKSDMSWHRLEELENGQEIVGERSPVDMVEAAERNDPCPCGSGYKFKKCHGKTPAKQADPMISFLGGRPPEAEAN